MLVCSILGEMAEVIGNIKKSERTKNRLKEILIDLCAKKGYQTVTIGDICEKAETYRSTFYRYYDTKDDMLREIEHENQQNRVSVSHF